MTRDRTSSALSLTDFIESINESSRRTRTVIIFLVVACVLGVAAVANSFPLGWTHQRILALAHDDKYLAYKLGFTESPRKDPPYVSRDQNDRVKLSIDSLRKKLIESYVDNVYSIKVPFFGVGFDVNDLSLVSGFGFASLLILLRYCLRNELVSLRLTESIAKNHKSDYILFYDLLATKQVLRVPEVDSMHSPSPGTRTLPRCVVWLPVIIYLGVFITDLYTALDIGVSISEFHTLWMTALTLLILLAIGWLARLCWVRWRENDAVWHSMWQYREQIRAEQMTNGAAQTKREPGLDHRGRWGGPMEMDTKRIQGTWKVTKVERDGVESSRKSTKGRVWQFNDGVLTISVRGRRTKQTPYDLRAAEYPRYIFTDGRGARGIYALDGDTLTVESTVSHPDGRVEAVVTELRRQNSETGKQSHARRPVPGSADGRCD